ncbi:hypothetical protein FG147_06295 [Thauera sp. UPWRP]|nr:hypothetical protein FG147_06295 [Thauera sp. UPWRP]
MSTDPPPRTHTPPAGPPPLPTTAGPRAHSPWKIVPIAEYALPTDSQPALLRRRWRSFARLLGGDGEDGTQAHAEAELRALPRMRLENLVPPLDWAPAAAALDEALDDAPADARAAHRPGVHVLVCPPACGHASVLAHWAKAHDARTIDPPDAKRILDEDVRWLDELADAADGRPWVLPRLERCFLRHASGLALLRGMLELAFGGRLGPGLIGCDSWAFAYVQRIWPLPEARVLTLQAFDGEALAAHFVRPHLDDTARRVDFRIARSGEPLLRGPEGEPADARAAATGDAHSPELRQLATHVRGNPGLAWHYWRRRLRDAPEPRGDAEASAREDDPGRTRRQLATGEDVVWIADTVEAPALPAESGEDDALLFHALLLHAGLPASLLARLLPLPMARIRSKLLRLEALGLVEADPRSGAQAEPCWQVAALAYPTVREFLRSRSYLTDAF